MRLLNAPRSPASHKLFGTANPKKPPECPIQLPSTDLRPLPQTAKPAPAFPTYALTATAEPAEFDYGVSSLRLLFAGTTTRRKKQKEHQLTKSKITNKLQNQTSKDNFTNNLSQNPLPAFQNGCQF